MTEKAAFRRWLLGLALCTVAVVFCVAYVDRPLALYFDAHVRHTRLWFWLNVLMSPLDLAVGGALFFMIGCGVWLISGRVLRSRVEIPFLCSASALWGVASEIGLKRIFGRGWPDPTFIERHKYGFHFLHGITYWDSFPSGTATVSSAIVSVLWILAPRWRVSAVLCVFVLAGAVVLANYHWLSDVIAGAFLGVSIGWATVRLLHPFHRFSGED